MVWDKDKLKALAASALDDAIVQYEMQLDEAETKTEDGKEFPRDAYAYTPDGPSTWKLRLWAEPDGGPDARIVGMAVAALGKGFRGQKADIPAEDLAAVKRKVRAAWKKANPDAEADEMPDAIKEGSMGEDQQVEAQAEELAGEIVPLVEKSVRKDGTIPIRIISPGWGTSGYYPPEVLERDGPKVFAKGLHAYWNHPTASESKERPERDLRDLAGVLTTDACYNADGPAGPGLYAEAKVMEQYRTAVEELAPHIGMSIRAFGKVKEGKAEDRKGRIVEELASAQSVDFVTTPGAGGRILELFEAAGREPADTSPEPIKEGAMAELDEMKAQNAALQTQLEEMRREKAELKAAGIVAAILAEADLPEAAKARVRTLVAVPTTEEGDVDEDALKANIEAAVTQEREYLEAVRVPVQKVGPAKIEGMGAAPPEDGAKALKEAFMRAGMSEELAAIAANGR